MGQSRGWLICTAAQVLLSKGAPFPYHFRQGRTAHAVAAAQLLCMPEQVHDRHRGGATLADGCCASCSDAPRALTQQLYGKEQDYVTLHGVWCAQSTAAKHSSRRDTAFASVSRCLHHSSAIKVVTHISCASYQQKLHHALPGLLHEGGVSLDLHAWASRHGTGRDRLGTLLHL